MAAAAIPIAMKVAPMIAGAFIGKKTSGASKDQKGAMEGTQQAAGALTQAGQPLMQQGLSMARGGSGDLDAAGGYYRNVLGSRQAGREALAPEMTSAMEFYRGAENKAKRTLQGGQRDQAVAELDRQKVAQMAGMLPAARRTAAEGLTQTGGQRISGGTSLTGQGTNALANAGYLQSGQFNQATTIRGQEGEGGSMWGKLLGDLAAELYKGGGKSPLPSTNLPVPIYGGPKL